MAHYDSVQHKFTQIQCMKTKVLRNTTHNELRANQINKMNYRFYLFGSISYTQPHCGVLSVKCNNNKCIAFHCLLCTFKFSRFTDDPVQNLLNKFTQDQKL